MSLPAMVKRALRLPPVEFGVNVNLTVPLPVPLAPAVIVTQLTFTVACQGQPAALAETLISAVPPPPASLPAGGVIVTVQFAGTAASCVTVKARLPTVIWPCRDWLVV